MSIARFYGGVLVFFGVVGGWCVLARLFPVWTLGISAAAIVVVALEAMRRDW
jgi:hypothetical protein